MKQKMNKTVIIAATLSVIFSLAFSPNPLIVAQNAAQIAGQHAGEQESGMQSNLSVRERQTVFAFEARAKQYAQMREEIEAKMPKLAKQSTPEQIQAHKTAFEERVRAARIDAKRGQMFTPDVIRHIRRTIRKEFRGQELKELRATVLEADTKGVPLRVNQTYPENKELVGMPPTLLLKLPRLPKQLRYRFVGRHLLLVDRENDLIVDYMRGALP